MIGAGGGAQYLPLVGELAGRPEGGTNAWSANLHLSLMSGRSHLCRLWRHLPLRGEINATRYRPNSPTAA